MESIRELYRIGVGPSSSHTMGPRLAAERFLAQHGDAAQYRVTLFGSLAATGKGHLTDAVLRQTFAGRPLQIVWSPEEQLPMHPNGMRFEALDAAGNVLASWQVYSVGGGAIRAQGEVAPASSMVYDLHSMASIMARCEETGQALWEYVEAREGPAIWPFLREVWQAMSAALQRGLRAEGVLPGALGLARKAWAFQRKAGMGGAHFQRTGMLSAYALAVAEENAAGGVIVTAPTCGSCGVLPAVVRYVEDTLLCSEEAILRALATAGLIGNLVKTNASISGAEVGCGGEVGAACAMAAGAATQLLAGTVRQIEYAAETALEHHLGLTCDPVAGLVQIPCIERNAFAATRALTRADYALFTDGSHRITFDQVVEVMEQTGHDLPSPYRETASGGLAEAYRLRPPAGPHPRPLSRTSGEG